MLPVPEAITQLARVYLANAALEARGLGFVILHRCGADFYFLIVCTWRGNNEVWETVFYKEGEAMSDFALFPVRRHTNRRFAFGNWRRFGTRSRRGCDSSNRLAMKRRLIRGWPIVMPGRRSGDS